MEREKLQFLIPHSPLGFSLRRLCEHIYEQQLNPFPPITRAHLRTASEYIDLIEIISSPETLSGITLADLRNRRFTQMNRSFYKLLEGGELIQLVNDSDNSSLLNRFAKTVDLYLRTAQFRGWCNDAERMLETGRERLGKRGGAKSFGLEARNHAFRIAGLESSLIRWLMQRPEEVALIDQWVGRIENLSTRGLKEDELRRSGIRRLRSVDRSHKIAAKVVAQWVRSQLRPFQLSILLVNRFTRAQLDFLPVEEDQVIRRIKPKLRQKQESTPRWRDRILGYWVDEVVWDDLSGKGSGWIAFNHRGKPLSYRRGDPVLVNSAEEAKAVATNHAKRMMPRVSALGYWNSFTLTGGQKYREWLITLPHYPESFLEGHFRPRNVLMHIRSDVREGPNGDKVLMLQEVQSDWCQQARCSNEDEDGGPLPEPPWLTEWPALALKLMLLHASQQEVDALAWTTGQMQIDRYSGDESEGLRRLYDRTLPKEADRILRPFHIRCENIWVSHPKNFYIESTIHGFEVYNDAERLMGRAPTWREARHLIPEDGQEQLIDLPGIRLSPERRKAILDRGFYAWGNGIV